MATTVTNIANQMPIATAILARTSNQNVYSALTIAPNDSTSSSYGVPTDEGYWVIWTCAGTFTVWDGGNYDIYRAKYDFSSGEYGGNAQIYNARDGLRAALNIDAAGNVTMSPA